MRDQIAHGEHGGLIVRRGQRKISNGSVRINRSRFTGPCLLGREGQKIEVTVFDVYALEYTVYFEDGNTGSIKWAPDKAK